MCCCDGVFRDVINSFFWYIFMLDIFVVILFMNFLKNKIIKILFIFIGIVIIYY